MTPKEMALCAAKALDEKKGKEISAIEITDLTALADYFVFCTGSSNTQINALCGAVEKNLEEEGGVKVLRSAISEPAILPSPKDMSNAPLYSNL